MKRIILILIFILPLISITSCKDNTVDSQKKTTDLAQLEAQFSKVGKMHNEGLDHIYKGFKNSKKINSSKQLFKVLSTSGQSFFKNNLKTKEEREKAIQVYNSNLEKMKHRSNKLNQMDSNAFSSAQNAKLMSSSEITSKQRHLIKKLFDVISAHTALLKDKNASLATYNKELNELKNQADNQLDSKKKLIPIVIGAIVAKSSMKYWQKNQDKWAEVFQNKLVINDHAVPSSVNLLNVKTEKGPVDTIINITSWDAAGAITGALHSLADGSAESTEGVGIGVEALGGGLLASAGYDAATLVQEAGDWIKSWF